MQERGQAMDCKNKVGESCWILPNYRLGRKLKALNGRPILAWGKRESVSAPPQVKSPER